MKIIVTGATGLVGAEVLRLAIEDKDIQEVIALSRRQPTVQHAKIRTILHQDFLNYTGLGNIFHESDACLWCLGISVSQVNKQQYHVITYDYTVAAASAMLAANPQLRFVFLSGEGADPSEKSRLLFERVKGKAENALVAMPFQDLYIARPGAIRPINKNPNAPFVYKLFTPLYGLMEFLTPAKVITSVEVARALLDIAKHGGTEQVLRNPALKERALAVLQKKNAG